MLECCSRIFFLWVYCILKKRKRITRSAHLPPHGPFLESGCVKFWHADMSLHRFVTPRLWSSDTLMSPQCQLIDAEYMTPSHPCLLFVGTFSETVKTLLRSCKNWVRAATADGEDADARNGGARCFDIRDTIQSWWLFVGISLHRCAAGKGGGGCLLEVMLKLEMKRWPNLSVKSPESTTTTFGHLGLFPIKRPKKPAQDTYCIYFLLKMQHNMPTQQCTCEATLFLLTLLLLIIHLPLKLSHQITSPNQSHKFQSNFTDSLEHVLFSSSPLFKFFKMFILNYCHARARARARINGARSH